LRRGLSELTVFGLQVFGLSYLSYVAFHAVCAGFSGCKTSLVDYSGFTSHGR
jgi:hypothetical protein